MRRRNFLKAATASALFSRIATADSFPADLKITRIISFDLISQRSKIAGKNARRDVHGSTARDRMVRLFTNIGVQAVARCWKGEEVLAELLGKNPFADFKLASRQMPGPLGRRTMVLWDLAGRLLNKPVYALLGGQGAMGVPVYDGSIYFADLLPQYASRWRDRFKQEIDMGLKAGHRAFKVKIGRGNKWMDRREGDARDVQVVETIRKHAGDDVILGVDANNGFDLAGAKRFIDRTGELDIAFFEEPFPELVEPCLELKGHIAERGLKTMLADGEGQDDWNAYQPLVDAKAVDVLQGDMNSLGIEGTLAEAAMAHPQGILIAPHNWGSLLGFYLQLHIGLAIPNFYRAERDPLSNDVLVADGYKIDDGVCTVPDAPGFGLAIHEKNFERVRVNFDLKAVT
jgi:L-alanine-DL-glutamate epimerase-like enolase superfamily enzyme